MLLKNDKKELTHIDLFSGIGGFTLAAEWAGFRTVAFCEKENFCQKVLKKHWPGIPIIPEIRDFDGTKYRGATILTGGFPCQPFSVAGQRRGKDDDRYLWPEMLRIIKEAKPRWILAENVAGIVKLALGEVLSDLEGIGYDFPRDHKGTPIVPIIPACSLNAPHRRYRIWIVAKNVRNSGSLRLEGTSWRRTRKKFEDRPVESIQNACDTSSDRYQGRHKETRREKRQSKQRGMCEPKRTNSHASNSECLGWQERTRNRIEYEEQISKGQNIGNGYAERLAWQENWLEVAARFCRVDDGVSDRIHRLKALGNAIVPQIAYEILKNIAWIENNRVA